MKRLVKILLMAGTAIVTGSSLLVGIPAAAAEDVTCDSGFGARVPVLMVHGFDSNSGMWTQPGSLGDILNPVSNVRVVPAFNYTDNHFDWVTNGNIGDRLAKTIDCLSQASKVGGGAGKVVVVAHSMGGLATLYASHQTVDGRKVADELGDVFTLGAPYLGSPVGNVFGRGWRWYCGFITSGPNKDQEVKRCQDSEAVTAMQLGSSKLSELGTFPSNVRVRAIGGNVKAKAQLLFAEVSLPLNSDLVVPIDSATAKYTSTGLGDGKYIFACDVQVTNVLGQPDVALVLGNLAFKGMPECWHNELYKNQTVQKVVKDGITQYVATLNKPATYFYGLGLQLPSSWKVAKNTQYESFADDSWTLLYDSSRCEDSSLPSFCPTIVVVNLKGSKNKDPYGESEAKVGENCYWDHLHDDSYYGKPVTKATLQIGGENATYQQQAACGPDFDPTVGESGGVLHAWRIPNRNIVVFTSRTDDKTVKAAQDMLAGAAWK